MVDTGPVRAFLDEKHVTLAERVSAFATRVLAPLAEPADDTAARVQARELLVKLGAVGWLQPIRDQDWRACCLIREALAAASPLADAVFALQTLGVVPMLLSANATMRNRWLEPAMQGRAMASFAMTEPDVGSDVASLGATAEPDGDAYVLSGTKTFISNAGIADFYTVFATTDRAKKDKGIACFVVAADTPGLRLVRTLVLSAPHPLGEIAFQKARVPSACRLDTDGEGFKLGLATLDRVRCTVGAAACGMAARALAEALAHAKARRPTVRRGTPRSPDRGVPADSGETGPHGHRPDGRALARLSRRVGKGPRSPARHARGCDGEGVRYRSGAAHCR